MQNDRLSRGGVVDIKEIDRDCYKLRPPRWVYLLFILAILMILVLVIFHPESAFALKLFGVAISFAMITGVLKSLTNANSATLIADRNGLYFPGRIAGKYFLIPWAQVITIEKASFPLNSRGLRVHVDYACFHAAANEIGNVVRDQGMCFVYTIPQLRNRDQLISDLESIKSSSRSL
jgi:hypothetical protein